MHRVTYSVGRAGKYLLHVRLRNQALPLAGSPFSLEVRPGVAHAQSTQLPQGALPLRGIVGLGQVAGCHVTMCTADKLRNVCDKGGAKIACTCSDAQVTLGRRVGPPRMAGSLALEDTHRVLAAVGR